MAKLIFIAGGGTGGHIYPAIAIAERIRNHHPEFTVHFVGTLLGLEKKIIPREGFPISYISSRAMNNMGLVARVLALFSLLFGFFQSLRLLYKLKPAVVLGVGGYASGPMMLAAICVGKPTAVFEPNAYPGFTNRCLASFVKKAFINFKETASFFKTSELSGFPVRQAVESSLISGQKVEVAVEAPLDSNYKPTKNVQPHILIFGGSQGARGINKTVLETAQKYSEMLEGFQIVHQTGSTDWAHYDSEYKKLNLKNLQHFEFLYDMPDRYRWADLVICRAGAATLAELACIKKAAILIPFPFAADNHQQKNAEAFVRGDAAQMILQKDFTAEKFIEVLEELKSSPEKFESFKSHIGSFFIPGATEKIAKQLVGMG